MKVLYDYQAFAMQKYGGVSRCFAELAHHLPIETKYIISIKESDNVYIQDIQGLKPARDKFNKFLIKGNFKGKWNLHKLYDRITKGHYYPNYNQYHSIQDLKRGDFDIFHPTFFDDYFLPYLKGKPFVLTIHDMIPERYPQYYIGDPFQIDKKRKLAKLSQVIITVSETTKKDVIDILNVPDEKIHVIYHGCSFPKETTDIRPIVNPYILFVGDRKFYKNFNLFVKHSLPFLHKHQEIAIVCTGSPFTNIEESMFVNYNLNNRFIHYWASTDKELYSLYHHAFCFVYPSEYEGFGIPILEAYRAGCPVLLNNASCFPEIAGDAAIYFDMNNVESNLSGRLSYIYSMNDEEKSSLIGKQNHRLNKYSWEESAKKLNKIYHSLL